MSKKNSNSNQNIKCDVDSCKFNNCEEGCCELNSISVSCTCNNNECEKCEETVCASFATKGSPITDNEYEVQSEIS